MLISIYIFIIFFLLIDINKNRFLLTPVKVFNCIWIFVLFFYNFKLSYIQQDFSNRTLLIFLLCIISFNIGYIFLSYFEMNKKNKKKYDFTSNSKIKLEKKIFYVDIVFILAFFVEIIYSKGFPLMWKVLGDARTYMDFGIPSFHGMLNGLAISMNTFLIFRKRDKNKYIYIIYALLIISRQILISMFLQAIISNLMINAKKGIKVNYKKYVAIFFVILIIFVSIGNFRSTGVMKSNFLPRENYVNLSESVMWIYSYVFFSFSNFNNLVSITDGNINKGISMLELIIPTAFLNAVNITKNYSPYFLVSSCFNVSTYLPEIYLDFGIFGIIIFNFIIGMIGTFLYNKVVNTNYVKWIFIYSTFMHNIIMIFFTNMFLYLPIVVQYFYFYFIFKNEKIERKK